MKFIAVTNDAHSIQSLANKIRDIMPSVDAVILREKSKTKQEIRALLHLLQIKGVDFEKIIIHGDLSLTTEMNITRVHFPESVQINAQELIHSSIIYGKSVHDTIAAVRAERAGASWLLYGHIYETNCKKGIPSRGIDSLKALNDATSIPLYAIGGILPEHIKQLLPLKVAGIAVMSTIFESENPKEVVQDYRQEIEKGANINGENSYD